MPRMYADKSSVFGSAGKHRPARGARQLAKAAGRDFAVRSALGSSDVVTRHCYTCEKKIACDLKPVADPASPMGLGLVPKYRAPLICRVCREDKAKFKVARKAMLEFFGWNEEFKGEGGFEA